MEKRYEQQLQPGVQSESGARGATLRQDPQLGGNRRWTTSQSGQPTACAIGQASPES